MTVALRTERLTLRGYDAAHAPFVLDLYSRAEVQWWLGDGTQRVRTLAEARQKIDRWNELHGDHPVHGVWLVSTREGEPLGTLLLKPIPDSGADTAHDIEIGWHLHPRAWGHGYATEAARGVLEHTFSAGVTRVVAVTHPANQASQAVCRRLGMRSLGLSRAYYDAECALFEITAPADAIAPATGRTSSGPGAPGDHGPARRTAADTGLPGRDAGRRCGSDGLGVVVDGSRASWGIS
ncbi:GNAT family N-acetyltransferase [Kocuria rhizophila]|uniref:GNAT family N-acetyltransferase n=1 Tax=Kocuria rhizophila TaxID=72000 RepID=UPI0022F043D0|nr:GNAT family N-acetyltransferase [Kocuria rhizophila]MDA4827987.1 GNAT family N-acetyltransferase [Kocuria rhizophila]